MAGERVYATLPQVLQEQRRDECFANPRVRSGNKNRLHSVPINPGGTLVAKALPA